MFLIQLLLPLHDNAGQKFGSELFDSVRHELVEKFHGVTAFIRSPATGLWKASEEVNRDEVVMFEVLAPKLEADWWAAYRQKLENEFHQEEILIWASRIERL